MIYQTLPYQDKSSTSASPSISQTPLATRKILPNVYCREGVLTFIRKAGGEDLSSQVIDITTNHNIASDSKIPICSREICLARQIIDPTIVNTPPSIFITSLKERLNIYFCDK